MEKTNRIEEYYVRAISDSSDAIIVQDFKGKILAWNKGAEIIYGYKEEEALKMNIIELIPRSKVQEALGFITKLIEGEKVKSFETQRIAKDGSVAEIILSASVVEKGEEKLVVILTVERDITESKKQIKQIIENEKRLNLILDSIPEGIDIIDENMNIVWLDKKFIDIFGKDSIGKKCYEVYKDDKKQCDNCPLKNILEIGEIKTVIVTGIAGGKTFEIKHIGIKMEDGKKAILEIFRDETESIKIKEELKKYTEKLEKMNKIMTGRELEMIELKNKIKELEIINEKNKI